MLMVVARTPEADAQAALENAAVARGLRDTDPATVEDRVWILDTGCALDLVQEDTLPNGVRKWIEPADSGRTLLTAGGPSSTSKVVGLQIEDFGENILPCVMPQTPNVLSLGRRCRQDGYTFIWEAQADVPRLLNPD